MQKIALQFKAQLDNITDLRPVGEDFRWYLKVRLLFKVVVQLGRTYHIMVLVTNFSFVVPIVARRIRNGFTVVEL